MEELRSLLEQAGSVESVKIIAPIGFGRSGLLFRGGEDKSVETGRNQALGRFWGNPLCSGSTDVRAGRVTEGRKWDDGFPRHESLG